MKILVLGSNGLVGSSVKKVLSTKDTSLYDSYFSTRSSLNLFSSEETKRYFKNLNPDIIINCAAKVGGIVANNENKSDFIIDNLKINLNIFEAAKELTNVKIINLGSSCIYPLNAKNPIKEDMIMTGELEPTNSPYAMAKLASIELGKAISYNYGHEVVNLMPTNLYGPNDNFDFESSHVIPGLISRMHKAKFNKVDQFKIWGSGKPLREFLYVEDLANAIIYIIDNEINQELINIGSNEEISIKDLSLKIKKILDFKGDLIFDKSKPDGNPRKLLDSSNIFNLGWKPKVVLDEGLLLTYEWYLENVM
jgi:GDP-L-fucose synthase